MPITKLTPESYRDYFEQLAVESKDILHNAETHKQFLCVDMDEVEEGTFQTDVTNQDDWMFILEDMTGRIGGEDAKHLSVIANGAFLVLKHCEKGDRVTERIILDDAFKIGKKFLAKMKKDMEEYAATGNDNVMSQFKPNSIKFEKLKAVLDNCFGYRFEFEAAKGEMLKYDESDWNF